MAKPRKKTSTLEETNAYAPPEVLESAPKTLPEITKGQRLAGALFIVWALLTIADKAILSTLLPLRLLLDTQIFGATAVLILGSYILTFTVIVADLVLGSLLLAKKQRFVKWAILRIVVGMMVVSAAQLYLLRNNIEQTIAFFAKFLPSIGILLLLSAKAQNLRLIVGSSMFGLYSLATLWAIGVEVSGVNPLAPMVQSLLGQIEPDSVHVVTGQAAAYELTFPRGKWYLGANVRGIDGKIEADRWILRPDVDAQIVVDVDESPDIPASPDEYATTTLPDFENGVLTGQKREKLRAHPEIGRVVSYQRGGVDDSDHWIIGVIVTPGRGYLIQAHVPHKVFPEMESELRAIIESFELPPAQAAPALNP